MGFSRLHSTRLGVVEAKTTSLLRQVFALRYRVYCEECQYLPAEQYPAGLETDDYDAHAVHFAAVENTWRVVGTVRLVPPSPQGFPLQRFSKAPDAVLALAASGGIGEVSRLAVSESACSLALNGIGAIPGRQPGTGPARTEVALELYRAVYQASRRCGYSHLLAAMEAPLARLLASLGFPFRAVGPEFDYHGPVRPYVLDLAEFDTALLHRCPATFAWFRDGLCSGGQADKERLVGRASARRANGIR